MTDTPLPSSSSSLGPYPKLQSSVPHIPSIQPNIPAQPLNTTYNAIHAPLPQVIVPFHPYARPALQSNVALTTAARIQALNAARQRTLLSAAAQAQAQALRNANNLLNNNANNTTNVNNANNTSNTNNNANIKMSNTSNNATNNNNSNNNDTDANLKNNSNNNNNNNNNINNNANNNESKPTSMQNNNNTNMNSNNNSNTNNSAEIITSYPTYSTINKPIVPNSSIANISLKNYPPSIIGLPTFDKTKKPKKKVHATHQYQLRTAAGETWVDPTMTEWAENDFRIFCGDLGNEVSDAMLTSAFSKYPSFSKAKVVRDKRTGKSKGYGFVSFMDPNDFIRAFKEMNGKYVGNRPIKLRKSKWKERTKKVKNFKQFE